MLHPSETALLDFASGPESEGDRARVANHLAGCERCRRVVQAHREVRAALNAAPEAAPNALMTRIAASRAAGARVLLPQHLDPVAVRPAMRWLWRVGAAGAAAAIAFYLFGVRPDHATATQDAAVGMDFPFGWSPTVRPGTDTAHYPPATGLNPSRLKPLRLEYEERYYANDKLVSSGPFRTVTIARLGGDSTGWRLVEYNDYAKAQSTLRNTVIIDGQTLNALRWSQPLIFKGKVTDDKTYYITPTSARMVATHIGFLSPHWQGRPNPFDTTYALPATAPAVHVARSFADQVAVVMALPLAKGWRGSTVDLNLVPSMPVYYHDYEVTGTERITVPAGECDCWRVTERRDNSAQTYVQKSDGVIVKIVIAEDDGKRDEIVLVRQSAQ